MAEVPHGVRQQLGRRLALHPSSALALRRAGSRAAGALCVLLGKLVKRVRRLRLRVAWSVAFRWSRPARTIGGPAAILGGGEMRTGAEDGGNRVHDWTPWRDR
jgi:hypothetical protein